MPAPFLILLKDQCNSNQKDSSADASPLPNGSLGTSRSGALPPELMVLVFAHTIPSSEERHLKDPRQLPPFTLAHVCKAWRTLVIGSPQLWVDVATGFFGADSARAKEILHLWVGRAGDAPLSLRHLPTLKDRLPLLLDGPAYAKCNADTVALVRDTVGLAPQMQNLSLRVLKTELFGPLLDGLKAERGDYQTTAFPVLEDLRLYTTDPGAEDEDHVFTSIDLACPALQSLTLDLLSPNAVPGPRVARMRSMRRLELNQCSSLRYCLGWVDLFSELTELTLKLSCSDQETDFVEDPETGPGMDEQDRSHLEELDVESLVEELTGSPVIPAPPLTFFKRPRVLSKLKSLDIQGTTSPANVSVLLGALGAPNLVSLRLANIISDESTQPGLSPLRAFLSRCAPKLVAIELTESRMDADEICECLTLLPDLCELKLGKLDNAEVVLEQLTLHASDAVLPAREQMRRMPSTLKVKPTVLCPKLETISLPNSRIPFDSFIEMVVSRGDRTKEESQPLSMVGVDVKTARKMRRHARVTSLIEQGLTIEEVENYMILAF